MTLDNIVTLKWVKDSRSLTMVPFESLGTVS